jgi:hypothetical protein
MTAQVTSGITKNEMTAQVTSGITKNEKKLKKVTSGNPDKFDGSTGVKKTEKLKQDEYEQRRVLERVAQTHFVIGSTYDTDDSVSHGSKDMSHGRNEKEYVRYVRYGESRERRYESREEREFRCAIARSEFGERKQVFGFVFKSWCAER